LCNVLTIKSPATHVILSISIPHYQFEQLPYVLKQCANIVTHIMYGINILTYISLTYISWLWFEVCISYIKPNLFQTVCLSPHNHQLFIQVPVTSLTKHQQQHRKTPNDKPNSLKHVRHIVPKLQQTQPLYQSAMPVNSTVQQYVLVNTKVTHNWNINFLFHLTLYVLCGPVTKM
jgi:hypothetical protein